MTALKEELDAIIAEAAQRSGYSNADDLMALMILEVRKLRLTIEKQHQPRTTPPSLLLDNQILTHKYNGNLSFKGGQAAGSAQSVLQVEAGKLQLSYPRDRKISVIKAVRSVTGLGLKEAKDITEGAFYETDRHMVDSLNREFAIDRLDARAMLVEM